MIKLNQYGMEIKLDIEPGVYVYESFSGDGKTYLFNSLKKATNMGVDNINACCITYDDVRNIGESKLESLIKPESNIIILDRADLYKEKIDKNLIKAVSGNKIMLIDCKSALYLDAEVAYIEYSKFSIEVYS